MKTILLIASLLVLSGCAKSEWEHKTFYWPDSDDLKRMIRSGGESDFAADVSGPESVLNDMGKYGWELVAIEQGKYGRVFYVKRHPRKDSYYWTVRTRKAEQPVSSR